MDFLQQLQSIALYLLPVVGLVLLVSLCVLIVRLIAILKGINVVVEKSKTTVDSVNNTLEEIKKPVATVVKITDGVDAVYDFGEKAMRGIAIKLVELLNYCKQLLNSREYKEDFKEENDGEEG